jgi:glyoxylase-like metal-dependent hydrolase (beta-lactamase superfamily II)
VVIVADFPAEAFGTNCYVVAPGPGEECVIVDPGVGVEGTLADVLRALRLRPAAVLLTHGHLDHVFSVTPVCSTASAPAYVHPADRYRLRDPWSSLGEPLRAMLVAEFGPIARWAEPDDVRDLEGDTSVGVAGLRIGVVHAPGHTEGSVMFALDGVPEGTREAADRTLISGDVLFAGSIGRTDLPGGDHAAMQRSLRERVLPLDDATLVLPGHGDRTTIGRERHTNPFLLQLAPSR